MGRRRNRATIGAMTIWCRSHDPLLPKLRKFDLWQHRSNTLNLPTKATFLKPWAPNFSKYGPAGGRTDTSPTAGAIRCGHVPDGLQGSR